MRNGICFANGMNKKENCVCTREKYAGDKVDDEPDPFAHVNENVDAPHSAMVSSTLFNVL